jgi:hypothetical protein
LGESQGRNRRESASEPDDSDREGERKGPDTAEGVPPEALLVVLRGIGSWMFLTDRHLIVARDGADWRPRSGYRFLSLDSIRHIRIELGSAPSGRIAVWSTGAEEVISMFFDARSLDRAQELVEVARPLIARSRRGPPGI